jgi:peptidoglycan/LPS O-acetylase OafA/YrhL
MPGATVGRMRRIESLDSLRGVAAAAVFIQHLSFSANGPVILAHWAVMLFFVLSGFVLSRPWVAGQPPHWGKFLVRRVLRLWPLVIVAVSVAVVLGTSDKPVTADMLGQCLFLTGQHGGCASLDRPVWSLVYEARVSLMFPILAVLVLRGSAAFWVAVALLLGGYLEWVSWRLGMAGWARQFIGDGLGAGLVITAHYVALFIFGILLAAHADLAARLAALFPALFFVAGIGALFVPSDTVNSLGAAMLIALTIGYAPISRIFQWSPLRWLGRVSYSLYLIHGPIIVAIGDRYGRPMSAVELAVSCVLCVLASEFLYRTVEAPCIRLGRWLTSSEHARAHELLPG